MKKYFNLQHCKYLHNSKTALLDFESLKKVWKVLIYVKRVFFEWKGFSLNEKGLFSNLKNEKVFLEQKEDEKVFQMKRILSVFKK